MISTWPAHQLAMLSHVTLRSFEAIALCNGGSNYMLVSKASSRVKQTERARDSLPRLLNSSRNYVYLRPEFTREHWTSLNLQAVQARSNGPLESPIYMPRVRSSSSKPSGNSISPRFHHRNSLPSTERRPDGPLPRRTATTMEAHAARHGNACARPRATQPARVESQQRPRPFGRNVRPLHRPSRHSGERPGEEHKRARSVA